MGVIEGLLVSDSLFSFYLFSVDLLIIERTFSD